MYDIITLLVEDHDNFIHILADRKHNEAFVVIPPGTPKASVKCWLKKA